VYIRNVGAQAARRRAIERLAQGVAEAGSSLLLAADTFAMAEHAAEHGLISAEALAAVLAERIEEQGVADLKPTRLVAGKGASDTRRAVEHGDVDEALKDQSMGGAPPNVRVEADGRHNERR
jgi:hypothetical protein